MKSESFIGWLASTSVTSQGIEWFRIEAFWNQSNTRLTRPELVHFDWWQAVPSWRQQKRTWMRKWRGGSYVSTGTVHVRVHPLVTGSSRMKHVNKGRTWKNKKLPVKSIVPPNPPFDLSIVVIFQDQKLFLEYFFHEQDHKFFGIPHKWSWTNNKKDMGLIKYKQNLWLYVRHLLFKFCGSEKSVINILWWKKSVVKYLWLSQICDNESVFITDLWLRICSYHRSVIGYQWLQKTCD